MSKPDNEVLQRAKSGDPLKSSYWIIVLNNCPEDRSMADLVHDFLEANRNGLDCLMPFMHTSSLPIFLEKLYQYGAFSELSKDHPIFDVTNLSQLIPGLNGRIKCLDCLVKLKELHHQSDQAEACRKIIEKIRVGKAHCDSSHKYTSIVDGSVEIPCQNETGYEAFREGMPSWKMRCYALLAQQNHPLGDVYRFKNLFQLLEMFDARDDLMMSYDLLTGVMGYLGSAKKFLGKEELLGIYLKLEALLDQFEDGCYIRFTHACEKVISWLEVSDDTVYQVHDLRESVERTKKVIAQKVLVKPSSMSP